MPLRLALAVTASLFVALPSVAAEPWQEYSFPESGFSAHFARRPSLIERIHQTTQSPDGTVKERVYFAEQGGVTYSVGIMDFAGKDADADEAVSEVVADLLSLGSLVLETSCYVDQMHGSEFVVMDKDGTRYTNGIFFVKEQLYQIKVVYPDKNSDPAGSSGISLFQAKFQFLDPY